MDANEIKEHIKEKLSNYKAMHKLMQDDYGKGAVEALEGLLFEIEEEE